MTINPSAALGAVWNTQGKSNARTASSAEVIGDAQDSNPVVSRLAKGLKKLELLSEANPDKFKEVTAKISDVLTQRAEKMTEAGNTKRAEVLNNMAADFKTASETGDMPVLRPGYVNGPMNGESLIQPRLRDYLNSQSDSTQPPPSDDLASALETVQA